MTPPFDTAAAWDALGLFLRTLVARFGRPAAIAHAALPARLRGRLKAWLDAAEALLRRLLLIEARRLSMGPRPRMSAAHAARPSAASIPAPREPSPPPGLPDHVRFRVVPPPAFVYAREEPAPRRASTPQSGPAHASLALARRLRAIAGVFDDPAFYIRATAEALAQDATLAVRIQTAPLDPAIIPPLLRTSLYDAAWAPATGCSPVHPRAGGADARRALPPLDEEGVIARQRNDGWGGSATPQNAAIPPPQPPPDEVGDDSPVERQTEARTRPH